MKHFLIFISFFFLSTFFTCVLFSQQTIVTDDPTYTVGESSAVLDVKSDSKGLLVPRMTASQRLNISSPATGLLIFQTDGNKGFHYYTGTDWIMLSSTLITRISDQDNDTNIQVEESADEDIIRMDAGGFEAVVIDNDGTIEMGSSSKDFDLNVIGDIGGQRPNNTGIKLQTDKYSDSQRLFFNSSDDNKHGFSFVNVDFDQDRPSLGNVTFYGLWSNKFYFLRHNNSNTGTILFTAKKSANEITMGSYNNPTSKFSVFGNGSFTNSLSVGAYSNDGIFSVFDEGEYANEAVDIDIPSFYDDFTEDQLLWQSFIPGTSGYLTKIAFQNSIYGGTFLMKIYEGSGTSGSLIGTSEILSPGDEQDPEIWVNAFRMNDLIPLTGGQQYTFAIEVLEGSFQLFYTNNSYPDGIAYYDGQVLADKDIGYWKSYMATDVIQPPICIKTNSDGNLGIGTNEPQAKLHVNGAVKIGEYILPEADGTNGQVLKTNGNGSVNWGTDANVNLWTTTGNNIYYNSGDVGIGSNAPQAKLHIGNVATTANEDALKIGIDGEYSGSIKFFDDDDETDQHFKLTYSAASQNIKFQSDEQDNILYLTHGGIVGIGTNSPENAALQIEGSATYQGVMRINNTAATGASFFMGSTNSSWGIGGDLFVMGHGTPGSANTDVTINSSGHMGIGTTDPACPLDVEGHLSFNPGSFGWFNEDGESGTASGTVDYSIRASNRILASEFNAVSDRRIKTNLVKCDPNHELQKINQLRLNRYRYKDTITKTREIKKGFIAQEVEKVFPEAVHTSSQFIPDIFCLSETTFRRGKNTIIVLEKDHSLKKGDQVRLICPTGQTETMVLQTTSSKSFEVFLEEPTDQIFVYGKKVDDFRAIDYDYIFSSGIGAIQAMDNQNKELRTELNELESRVENLEVYLKEVASKN